MVKQRLSLFISGKGSNAINLIHYFSQSSEVEIAAVLSTKENERVQSLCELEGINFELFTQKTIEALDLINLCHKHKTNLVILAVFVKKIPVE